MSNYSNNIAFAVRTVMLYKKQTELLRGCEFTLVVGALLNVFTSICPDGQFLVDFQQTLNSGIDIPHLPNRTKQDLEDYLRNIRNGLAHKTMDNFQINSDGTNRIISMEIASRGNAPVDFTLSDLESVLNMLENAISLDNVQRNGVCNADVYNEQHSVFTIKPKRRRQRHD